LPSRLLTKEIVLPSGDQRAPSRVAALVRVGPELVVSG
jgi:hypothetical protein